MDRDVYAKLIAKLKTYEGKLASIPDMTDLLHTVTGTATTDTYGKINISVGYPIIGIGVKAGDNWCKATMNRWRTTSDTGFQYTYTIEEWEGNAVASTEVSYTALYIKQTNVTADGT